MYNKLMIFEMLRWWYTDGWKRIIYRIGGLAKQTLQTFSVPLLAKTLFAPWRRIISSPGRGLDNKIRAWIDNLISRMVGFFVRLLVLVVAVVATLLTIVLASAQAALWPMLPLIVIGLLVWEIFG